MTDQCGFSPLASYGIIGDSRSAALVSESGSIDWCCWPRFDSASIFGRLLDRERGGHFTIRPTSTFRIQRRYVGPTPVLETLFETGSGRARLLDLMPVLTEAQKRRRLMPFREILRRIDGISGDVEFEVVFAPRFEYGKVTPRLERRSQQDICAEVGHQLLHLRSDVPLMVAPSEARARFVVRRGERCTFALAFSEDAPSVYPSIGARADEEIALTLDFWQHWSARSNYRGPYGEAVHRSALVLKLLAFAPSGAIVAAPTTSLPEHVGGVRNWDYRYCWLRDASFTVSALYDLGFQVEGDAYVQWLLHSTRLTHPAFGVLYDVYGEADVPESTLDHLSGYRQSRPVRVGNAASDQFQLDVYGEVLAALERFAREDRSLDRDTRGLLVGAADLVTKRWIEPDNGIWELRSGRFQHVHGKVMAWRALDCAERVARWTGIRADFDGWARARDAIRHTVLDRGYNHHLHSFVSTLDGRRLDGSLLTLPLVGFLPADDPRMLSTIAAVWKHLGRDDLIYRYRSIDDGLPGGEGAFVTCSFWLVASLALAGRLDEAHSLFRRLLARGNDLCLFSEEVDPVTGELLGNFPQGLTHIALINAALTLERAEQETTRRPGQ